MEKLKGTKVKMEIVLVSGNKHIIMFSSVAFGIPRYLQYSTCSIVNHCCSFSYVCYRENDILYVSMFPIRTFVKKSLVRLSRTGKIIPWLHPPPSDVLVDTNTLSQTNLGDWSKPTCNITWPKIWLRTCIR